MGGFSLWHILIFAIIVLLLFGGNASRHMMGDVGKGLKSFKQGMADEDKPAEPAASNSAAQSQQPIDITPSAPADQPPPPPRDDQSRD